MRPPWALLASPDNAHQPRSHAIDALQIRGRQRRFALDARPRVVQYVTQNLQVLGQILVPIAVTDPCQLRRIDQTVLRERSRVRS